jgi:hypothetical protein
MPFVKTEYVNTLLEKQREVYKKIIYPVIKMLPCYRPKHWGRGRAGLLSGEQVSKYLLNQDSREIGFWSR